MFSDNTKHCVYVEEDQMWDARNALLASGSKIGVDFEFALTVRNRETVGIFSFPDADSALLFKLTYA